jgi:hypothetical protein
MCRMRLGLRKMNVFSLTRGAILYRKIFFVGPFFEQGGGMKGR